MGIVEYIKALMEADRNARMTYEEIANKYCLPLYTVHRLLTGKQSFSSLKLATLEEMFPNARLEFGANRIDNEGTIERGVTQVAETPSANAAGKFRAAIISQLIDMDIPDDARTKALRLVKEA